MDSNLLGKVSQIIEIEDDVIDLDEAEKTPEEVIYEWDAKIRKKFSTFAVADNEVVLGDLMKEYLEALQEMTRSFEDNETLKNKVFCHINFLYSYYVELQCCTPDNYLSNMEDILTLFCNLELEVIRPLKKKDFSKHKYKKRIISVARRMIHVLSVYLLDRHDHILHVLIKMNTNKVADSCSEVLNILYMHFLTKVPAFNLCDESFCRNYIVFQKWKEIRDYDNWKGMDELMYKMFKRTPESIKNNETLRQILMPACSSTVDIVINLYQSFRAISSAYFKHVMSKRNTEMDDLDFNIDLGEEDEPTIALDDDNEEEVQFLKAYYEVERNMSNLSTSSIDIPEIDIFRKCKEEIDEDDDVQFVGITMLPKQPDFAVRNEENNCRMNNISSTHPPDPERISTPIPPLTVPPPTEKSREVENLNGITRIRIGSPRTVPESSSSCQVAEVQTTEPVVDVVNQTTVEPEPVLHPIQETNQPEVPFASNNTQVPSPISRCDDTVDRGTTEMKSMKSVEVQADNLANHLYNDYGLTTPPFDVQADEQVSRPVVYTDIGQNHKKDFEKESVVTRTVEVQVDMSSHKNCPYNDYGLTPPNDTHLEDHATRQEPLYTDIVNRDLRKTDSFQSPTHNTKLPQLDDSAQEEDMSPSDKNVDDSEYDGDDDNLDVNIDVEYTGADNENEPSIRVNPNLQVSEESSSGFKTSDQIDTGQKAILNSAPNIEPVTAESETKETFNGNTLKPLVSSNRTNGQSKDSTSTKIIYTSPQKVAPASLEDFSRFENEIHKHWNKMKENHEFEDILTGPISKVIPVKQTSLLSSPEKLDFFSQEPNSKTGNSRSSSPNEVTSPAYEGMDDFRNYYSASVNGRVPPPRDVRVPPGILKKNNTVKRKNHRLKFHESTCDHSEERITRSDGVLVPKGIGRDPLLNMKPRVVVERLSIIENTMKKVTLRVDYDKTTPHINARDVVRYMSPPRFSLKLDFSRSRHSPGKVKSFNDTYCKKVSSKCEKSLSSCCNQLAEEFTKLKCSVSDEKALNLTIPEVPIDPDSEFSNSPKFLQDTDTLVQHCLEETCVEAPSEVVDRNPLLLCDNSNFYKSQDTVNSDELVQSSSQDHLVQSNSQDNLIQSSSQDNLVETSDKDNSVKNSNSNDDNSESGLTVTMDDSLLKLPTAVPETYDFEKNLKNEVFSKIDWQNQDDSDGETRLPLKKRKLSVANNDEEKKEEISYPATPMISIAEVEALHSGKLQPNSARPFKTPAERKEMPPLPVFYNVDSDPSPIITDQFNINNHTYNNPTINYHMNNVPVPFINIPCGSYYSLPPILVPFNNVSSLNPQAQDTYVKKEAKKQGRQRRRQ